MRPSAGGVRKLAGLVAGVGAACGPESGNVPEMPLIRPPLMAVEMLADRPEVLDDSLGLAGAVDMVAVPEGYLVVDAGNDRLVIFDRRLRPIRAVGRSGSGPGELEAPLAARRHGDEVGVVELSNGRISFFASDGRFLRTLTLPVPVSQMDFSEDGSVILATRWGEAPLTAVDVHGRPRPFGGDDSPAADDLKLPSQDGVAVAVTGRIVVVGSETGHVSVYDRDGRLDDVVALPADLVEPVRATYRAFAEDLRRQGRRVIGHSLGKSTARQPDGRVLFLIAGGRKFGVLIDPDALRGRLLTVPDTGGVWRRLLQASAAVLEGDTITVLHGFGLSRFLIRGAGP